MPTNYILVDFENVQPDLSLLAGTTFKVKVFFGAKQQEGRDNFESASSTAASNFYGASASLASGMAAVAARIASNRVQAKAIQAALNKLA